MAKWILYAQQGKSAGVSVCLLARENHMLWPEKPWLDFCGWEMLPHYEVGRQTSGVLEVLGTMFYGSQVAAW